MVQQNETQTNEDQVNSASGGGSGDQPETKDAQDPKNNQIAADQAESSQEAASSVSDEKIEDSADESSRASEEPEKVRIEFPYSELIRERVPKAFEVAEKVATDWKNEGNFADLGITHPVAGIVAAQALTKAKEVEKKLEEKGVISMAKMGLAIAQSQIENLKSKIGK